MKRTMVVGTLFLVVASMAWAQTHEGIAAVIEAATEDDGALALEISVDDEDGGVYNVELSTGREVYVSLTGNEARVLERERDWLTREDRRVMRTLEESETYIGLADALARTVNNPEATLDLRDFYGAEYDFEFDRLVVEVEFRGAGRSKTYIDAFTGEIVQVRDHD